MVSHEEQAEAVEFQINNEIMDRQEAGMSPEAIADYIISQAHRFMYDKRIPKLREGYAKAKTPEEKIESLQWVVNESRFMRTAMALLRGMYYLAPDDGRKWCYTYNGFPRGWAHYENGRVFIEGEGFVRNALVYYKPGTPF